MAKSDQRITQVRPRLPDTDTPVSPAASNSPVFSVLEGTCIGRYELIYHIASGGMASVYAGRLVGMAGFERLVAVKVIHPHLSKEPAFVQMFLDEARLAAGISHPNVAEIYEVGEEHGVYYMVGELVRGKDLRQVVEKAKQLNFPLPHHVMVSAIAQICDGLNEVHTHTDAQGEPLRLIHRDVSTRNILISYKGHPKLIDFGAAWAKTKLSHTTNGMVKGKVGYMPPEQLRGEPLDHRADIYSLGVVLYTAVVGQHPFPYENEGEQIAKAMHGDFAKPSALLPDISPQLETVILRAMSTSVQDRYSSMVHMKKALQHYLATLQEQEDGALLQLMDTLFAEEAKQETERIAFHRSQQEETLKATAPSNKIPSPTAAAHKGAKRKWGIAAIWAAVVLLALTWVFALFLKTPAEDSTALASSAPDNDGSTRKLAESSPTVPSPLQHSTPKKTEAAMALIDLKGLLPGASLWIGGKEISSPVSLPQSNMRTIIEIRTPGYETTEISVIPKQNAEILVDMPAKVTEHRQTATVSKDSRPRKKKGVKQTTSTSLLLNSTAAGNNGTQKDNTPSDKPLSFETNPFERSNAAKANNDL